VQDHLGIKEKLHGVGHDIGGMIAHACATRDSEVVAGVALGGGVSVTWEKGARLSQGGN